LACLAGEDGAAHPRICGHIAPRGYLFLHTPGGLLPQAPCVRQKLLTLSKGFEGPIDGIAVMIPMKLGICLPHYGRPIEVPRMLTCST
jgi:hypothetical protein